MTETTTNTAAASTKAPESLAEWALRASPAELNAANWRVVHQGLLRARRELEATGATHSWIGPYIGIAKQEGEALAAVAQPVAVPAVVDPAAYRRPDQHGGFEYEDGITSFAHDPASDSLYTAAQVQAMLSGGIAPGWQAVPVEDTPSMWTAGGRAIKNCGGHDRDAASLAYKAMLEAAPQPPAPSGPEREPLTDEQIYAALDANITNMSDAKQDPESMAVIVQMARAIEKAHGIKP